MKHFTEEQIERVIVAVVLAIALFMIMAGLTGIVWGETPQATITAPPQATVGTMAVISSTGSVGTMSWDVRPAPPAGCMYEADEGRTLILASPYAVRYAVVLWSETEEGVAAAAASVAFMGDTPPVPPPPPPPPPIEGVDLVVIVEESSESTADQRRVMAAATAHMTNENVDWFVLDQDAADGDDETPAWAGPILAAAENKPLPLIVFCEGEGDEFEPVGTLELLDDEAQMITIIDQQTGVNP